MIDNARFITELTHAGLDWTVLERSCEQIVLFGSQADGRADPGSDWDLLCIGEGPRLRLPGVDLVWLAPTAVDCSEWLGRELAVHVAAYGRWLKGDNTWSDRCHTSRAAVDNKSRRIARRLATLERHWDDLGLWFRRRHAHQLRRDLQRHALLLAGVPVPSRPVLDAAWTRLAEQEEVLNEWAASADIRAPFFRHQLFPAMVDEPVRDLGVGPVSSAELLEGAQRRARQET